MKRIISCFLLVTTLALIAGCNDVDDGRIKMPFSSRHYSDRDYQEILVELEAAGFTNVHLEALDDLVTGWLKNDGAVEQVSIDGDITFSTDSKYPKDAMIVVTYHSFPTKEQAAVVPSELEGEEEGRRDVEAETEIESTQALVAEEVLTITNNNDLLNILLCTDSMNPIYKDFADQYVGRIVEFDGRVDHKENHSTYNAFDGSTKVSENAYDILISYGDYDPDQQLGPTIKIENISSRKLGHDDSEALPFFMNPGSNVYVKAKVGSYDESSGIFIMHYVLIDAR